MNGARSTYMRKGYLLTALAAAVLLAASSGTAYAQRVTIGFVGTSGEISEKAYLNPNSLTDPQSITVRVQGLRGGSLRESDIGSSLETLTIEANKPVQVALVTSRGALVQLDGTTAIGAGGIAIAAGGLLALEPENVLTWFDHDDDLNLMVAQSADGSGDPNWVSETIELKLTVGGTASVSPDIYMLAVTETHVAPVAKFLQPNFTLSEDSVREVQLDVASAIRGVPLPGDAATAFAATTDLISVRVSNQGLVSTTGCPTGPTDPLYNRKLFFIDLGESPEWTADGFSNTGVLTTVADSNIGALAGPNAEEPGTADFEVVGCGDGAGIQDPRITLTIMENNLVGTGTAALRNSGNFSIGAPLTISVDSDEAVPTLSFSPTDVEIDEGGTTSTVLLAEGQNADEVGMVKLSVEGDAMVSLMQDGEMLEEMGGYVYVDLDGNSSARLEAMSHSDPDLMDGEMAFKAWKLMEGGTDGAMIGEGYWFKVDVRGSTAVPALPLLGQLLLALFLMAGGARLYRRRQG